MRLDVFFGCFARLNRNPTIETPIRNRPNLRQFLRAIGYGLFSIEWGTLIVVFLQPTPHGNIKLMNQFAVQPAFHDVVAADRRHYFPIVRRIDRAKRIGNDVVVRRQQFVEVNQILIGLIQEPFFLKPLAVDCNRNLIPRLGIGLGFAPRINQQVIEKSLTTFVVPKIDQIHIRRVRERPANQPLPIKDAQRSPLE